MDAAEARRIARAVSAIENRDGDYEAVLAQAYGQAGTPEIIGITGPPGSGKSTLVDQLGRHWAREGRRVAVLAIDPSSPFSGGAILGDRIRQTGQAETGEGQRIYFRSLASRGHIGGLSAITSDAIAVLGHFGFDTVVVETVGAGQADLEIGETADCTVVVNVPGLGDAVQAAKAGLMEIGDILMVNKADLPGAEDCARTMEYSLATVYMGKSGVNRWRHAPVGASTGRLAPGIRALVERHGDPAREATTWTPPVLRISAGQGQGIAELAETIIAFLAWQRQSGRQAVRQILRIRAQLLRHLSQLLMAPFREGGDGASPAVEAWVARIAAGSANPLEAAQALAERRPPAGPDPGR